SLQQSNSALLARSEEAEDTGRKDLATGVLNRAWLDRSLDREFTQAVVFGRELSIAHLELDHFKNVTERYKEAGEVILGSCAQTRIAGVRDTDLVARYAREEFMIVLPGADRDVVKNVAQRILTALANTPHHPDKEPLRISASLGLATYSMKHRFPSVL